MTPPTVGLKSPKEMIQQGEKTAEDDGSNEEGGESSSRESSICDLHGEENRQRQPQEKHLVDAAGSKDALITTIASYNVPARHPFRLIIARGSIVDFSYMPNPQRSAIVISADGCGEGVDGAVRYAGGPNLEEDRTGFDVAEGSAVMTGPNNYGRLAVPYVIYASGLKTNATLMSAYSASLACGKSGNLEAIAFYLLSTGGYLAGRTVRSVVKIGLKAIRRFGGYPGLNAIYLCAYADDKAEVLQKCANEMFAPSIYMKLPKFAIGKKGPGGITPKGEQLEFEGRPVTSCESTPNENADVLDIREMTNEDNGTEHVVSNKQDDFIFGAVDSEKQMTVDTFVAFNIPSRHPFRFMIAKGSIVDFSYPDNPGRSAIVNPTDQVGLGGGRVNGAVSYAGGKQLRVDRQNLPTVYLLKEVRCPEGKAAMTGPNTYGQLKVSYVIHAFGGYTAQTLRSAYLSCLEHGKSAGLEAIAFSPLMAGFYQGSKSRIYDVFKTGLDAIRRFEGYTDLRAVYMYAYSETEREILLQVANEVFATFRSVVIPTKSVSASSALKKSGNILGRVFGRKKQKNVAHDESNDKTQPEVVANEQGPSTKMDSNGILVDLANKGFGDENLSHITEVLVSGTIVGSLCMHGNRLTTLDARFAWAVGYSTLKSLVLSNNLIGPEGARRLADALILNETIEDIQLGRNLIRDKGVIWLAGALNVNRTVKSIDLHYNQIRNDGAEKLADTILVNHSLLSLNLQRNLINDDGADCLANALGSNNTMKNLDLDYNPIDKAIQKKVNDIFSGPRESMKTPPRLSSFLFFTKLLELEEDRSSIDNKLGVLSVCISDVHTMKFYYTVVSILQRSSILTPGAASSYIQKGLSRTSQTCSCGDSISCFKLILEKAESDGYIQHIDFHRFDNQAEVKRMESASFIVDMMESIKSNTARIEGLEASVEAINCSLNSIKEGIRRQMKIGATVGFLCAALNAISFGVGGTVIEATINALGSIVDYSDLVHIQQVASQWGPGCVEQVETGMALAIDDYSEKLLHQAIQNGKTLAVVSATAAMINVQCSTKSSGIDASMPIKVACSIEAVEKLLEASQITAEEQRDGAVHGHDLEGHNVSNEQEQLPNQDKKCDPLVMTSIADTNIGFGDKVALASEALEEDMPLSQSATMPDKKIDALYPFPPSAIVTNCPEVNSISDSAEIPPKTTQLIEQFEFLTKEMSREEVMQWLKSHLPRLQRDDAVKYCECLMEDGFDSLDILADVMEGDLNFMKRAHKRSLIQRMKSNSVENTE